MLLGTIIAGIVYSLIGEIFYQSVVEILPGPDEECGQKSNEPYNPVPPPNYRHNTFPRGGRWHEVPDEECGRQSDGPYNPVPPPVFHP